MAKIRIVVTAKGLSVKGEGYNGPICESAVKYVADLLNVETVSEEHTQEYFNQPDQENRQ